MRLDCAAASRGAVMMQQRSSATLSLSLYHRPCERNPVCVSHWVQRAGNLLVFLRWPPHHPTQPHRKADAIVTNGKQKHLVMCSKGRKCLY